MELKNGQGTIVYCQRKTAVFLWCFRHWHVCRITTMKSLQCCCRHLTSAPETVSCWIRTLPTRLLEDFTVIQSSNPFLAEQFNHLLATGAVLIVSLLWSTKKCHLCLSLCMQMTLLQGYCKRGVTDQLLSNLTGRIDDVPQWLHAVVPSCTSTHRQHQMLTTLLFAGSSSTLVWILGNLHQCWPGSGTFPLPEQH